MRRSTATWAPWLLPPAAPLLPVAPCRPRCREPSLRPDPPSQRRPRRHAASSVSHVEHGLLGGFRWCGAGRFGLPMSEARDRSDVGCASRPVGRSRCLRGCGQLLALFISAAIQALPNMARGRGSLSTHGRPADSTRLTLNRLFRFVRKLTNRALNLLDLFGHCFLSA